ncbi:Pseudouridine-5'-phosphate glycosidase [Corynebacterium glaucum]|nr:Pseudouridine-5'-phosphate glycosidase [Corynebacterium glaucum]
MSCKWWLIILNELRVSVSDEVRNALEEGTPILGLESNVLSHGLPFPKNVELQSACDEAIRSRGVVPAITFIDRGKLCLGATEADLERLTTANNVDKVTSRDIAVQLVRGSLGATSVSASLAICELAGVPIFASAGLGGVHRDYATTMDMSGDLYEIARRRVIVVSAGVKKFLDIPKTVEVLETLNIPAVGFHTSEFPAFYCKSSGVKLGARFDRLADLAKAARNHIELDLGSGFLALVSPSDEIALDHELVESAVQQALARAHAENVRGKDITKYVMRFIDEKTNMRSRDANFEVMVEVVSRGAELAVALSKERER